MNTSEGLIREVLSAYKEEHRNLSENWRQLEAKTQGAFTASGIFLAAVFAFLNSVSQGGTWYERMLVLIAVALLVANVVFVVLAVRVRHVAAPPLGACLGKLVEDLCSSGEPLSEERVIRFLHDQIRAWGAANAAVRTVIEKKAKQLRCAQMLFITALGVVAAIVVCKVT